MTVSRRPGTTGIGEIADEDVDACIEFDDDDDDDDELFPDDDDDYFDDDLDGYRALRPEWMHPECADPCAALELGTCCKYPAGTLVRRALDLAEAVDRVLNAFDGSDSECAQTARELAVLFDSVPGLVAEIRAVLPGADKTVAAQLLCPIGRLNLVSLELAGRSGCPWACDDHGAPDRRPVLAPLASLLEVCDEALWAAILPRPRRRR
jgi:hypothetical protein